LPVAEFDWMAGKLARRCAAARVEKATHWSGSRSDHACPTPFP